MENLTWFENQIKAQDYFAEKVTLTQGGDKLHRSLCGGIASICTWIGVFVYGLMQVHDLYYHPDYNSFPVTYDFDYSKKIEVDITQNMPSY